MDISRYFAVNEKLKINHAAAQNPHKKIYIAYVKKTIKSEKKLEKMI